VDTELHNEVAREIEFRIGLRESFEAWCRYVLQTTYGQQPARHHIEIIKALQDVADGTSKRLILLLPPGSGKSTYSSDLFPGWYLSRHPDASLISASNTSDLAQAFSRRVRGRIREHERILGYHLTREAEELWQTNLGGQYRAVGVGGAITGFRADGVLIDDPIKSREQADSDTQREKLWQWWQDELMTRLKPDAWVVIIQTPWHEDDLVGRLRAREGQGWHVVAMPAQSTGDGDHLNREAGEWLWGDDSYGYAAEIEARRPFIDSRTWNSLYQLNPTPDEGDYWRKDWLRAYSDPPKHLRCYGASDYAVTDNGGDYTVHVVVGVDPIGDMYLMDLWRDRTTSDQWVEALVEMLGRWRPLEWAEESGQITSAVGPLIRRRMIETNTTTFRRSFASRADKAVRAQSMRGRMAVRGLYCPKSEQWYPAFESELLHCWAGLHDDQADAIGLIGQLLDHVLPAEQPRGARPTRPIIEPMHGGAIIDMKQILDKRIRAAKRAT